MKIGTLLSLPNAYSQYGSIRDGYGNLYTVDEGDIPDGAEQGENYAYKVDFWETGGLAKDLKEP